VTIQAVEPRAFVRKQAMMRGLFSDTPGGPDSLYMAEAPEPIPGPGEIVIGVKAAGVNFADTLIIQDKYQIKPQRPFSPGSEAAGVIRAIGDGVEGFAVGDRVIGLGFFGGMAEALLVKAHECHKIPAEMPFEHAAAFLTTYVSALHGLADRGHLKKGETLLVLGAAGGMGVAAIELGRAMGARVIAAASSEDKVAFALERGAHAGIVYAAGPKLSKDEQRAFADAIKAATGGEGADVVFDVVGGDHAEPALRATAWEGRFLVVGFAGGIPRVPLNLCLMKGTQIVGVGTGAFMMRDPAAGARTVQKLMKYYRAGKVKPHIDARYPLDQAAEAIRAVAERKAKGKVIVTID
jgi:NADPH2:quinone reductase